MECLDCSRRRLGGISRWMSMGWTIETSLHDWLSQSSISDNLHRATLEIFFRESRRRDSFGCSHSIEIVDVNKIFIIDLRDRTSIEDRQWKETDLSSHVESSISSPLQLTFFFTGHSLIYLKRKGIQPISWKIQKRRLFSFCESRNMFLRHSSVRQITYTTSISIIEHRSRASNQLSLHSRIDWCSLPGHHRREWFRRRIIG